MSDPGKRYFCVSTSSYEASFLESKEQVLRELTDRGLSLDEARVFTTVVPEWRDCGDEAHLLATARERVRAREAEADSIERAARAIYVIANGGNDDWRLLREPQRRGFRRQAHAALAASGGESA